MPIESRFVLTIPQLEHLKGEIRLTDDFLQTTVNQLSVGLQAKDKDSHIRQAMFDIQEAISVLCRVRGQLK